jgi:hypothetical protein
MMIRVARVWTHRSPSGPSFRRQPSRAGAEVPIVPRTGGPVHTEASPGHGGHQLQHQLEEHQSTPLL